MIRILERAGAAAAHRADIAAAVAFDAFGEGFHIENFFLLLVGLGSKFH